jgi:molybdate transport system substrate-binding protein
MNRRRTLFAASAALSTAFCGPFLVGSRAAQATQTTADKEIFIAAASDLQFVLPELVKLYADASHKIHLRFGASATLATQIIRGLQTDIFLSADATQIEVVRQAGFADSEPFTYAIGHIAVASFKNTALSLDAKLARVRSYFESELAAGRRAKLAIANPTHAPYGQAASQALSTFGYANFFKPHLVLGENVAQTAQYVASGAVTAGIIGVALCKSAALSGSLQWVELDRTAYSPIKQTAVQVKANKTAPEMAKVAAAFLQFLKSEKAKALFVAHGFGLPS